MQDKVQIINAHKLPLFLLKYNANSLYWFLISSNKMEEQLKS